MRLFAVLLVANVLALVSPRALADGETKSVVGTGRAASAVRPIFSALNNPTSMMAPYTPPRTARRPSNGTSSIAEACPVADALSKASSAINQETVKCLDNQSLLKGENAKFGIAKPAIHSQQSCAERTRQWTLEVTKSSADLAQCQKEVGALAKDKMENAQCPGLKEAEAERANANELLTSCKTDLAKKAGQPALVSMFPKEMVGGARSCEVVLSDVNASIAKLKAEQTACLNAGGVSTPIDRANLQGPSRVPASHQVVQ